MTVFYCSTIYILFLHTSWKMRRSVIRRLDASALTTWWRVRRDRCCISCVGAWMFWTRVGISSVHSLGQSRRAIFEIKTAIWVAIYNFNTFKFCFVGLLLIQLILHGTNTCGTGSSMDANIFWRILCFSSSEMQLKQCKQWKQKSLINKFKVSSKKQHNSTLRVPYFVKR